VNLPASPDITALVSHLEQSTLIVLVAWMVTLVLRTNRPSVRFWIWFLASVKFLLPFSILVNVGEWLRRAVGAPFREPAVAEVIRRIPLPLSGATPPFLPSSSANAHSPNLVLLTIAVVWGCGSLVLAVRWWCEWRKIRGAQRNAVPSGLAADVPILFTSSLPEPGVYGVVCPVLLLPVALRNHLSHDELSAIISHEVCHVRRRDNLLFAIHMMVETLFWFHPLVWWIGSHLIEERERACDEGAIFAGNDAQVYAQSILNVCKCCVASSPVLVSGIAGANLKNRITRIVGGQTGRRLGLGKFALLSVAGLSAVVIPAGIGLIGTAETRIESGIQESSASHSRFEVATIRPGRPSPRGSGVFINGRRFEVLDTKLEQLISFAYGLDPRQVVGAPDWMNKDEFDITAVPEGDGQPTIAQWKEMMQKLLAERFNLRFHRDTRILPVYLLTVARSGAKLTKSEGDPSALPMVYFPGQWGKLVARNAAIKDFAVQIQGSVLDRPVVDKTGLIDRYDFTLSWTPDESQFTRIDARIPTPADAANAPPPLFTAIQEQLGLKLEAGNARADVIVIDRLERPTPN
jgi:bla regulator protein blaR1